MNPVTISLFNSTSCPCSVAFTERQGARGQLGERSGVPPNGGRDEEGRVVAAEAREGTVCPPRGGAARQPGDGPSPEGRTRGEESSPRSQGEPRKVNLNWSHSRFDRLGSSFETMGWTKTFLWFLHEKWCTVVVRVNVSRSTEFTFFPFHYSLLYLYTFSNYEGPFFELTNFFNSLGSRSRFYSSIII